MSRRPDIVYFISDEHAYHAMGHAGDANLLTPSLALGAGLDLRRRFVDRGCV